LDVNSTFALSLLDEYGKQKWNENRELARVRLAILKLAEGNLDRLLDLLIVALSDYRDVLSPAEYPRYAREISPGGKPFEKPNSLRDAAIEDDWKQYREWLERGRD
jgi:hypothetical protein